MKNQRYSHALHIAVPALVDTSAGQPVKIGQFVGVALNTAKAGEKVTVWLDGSYDVTVVGALTAGQIVYIKTDNTLTATASGNYPFGVAVVAKGTGTGVTEVAPFGKITNTAALA